MVVDYVNIPGNPLLASKIYSAKKELDQIENKSDRPAPNIPNSNSMRPVTDLKYYMDGYLRDNLNEVPKFLKEGWDCVIILSGNAKVRIGKSTLAMQIAYYLAWLLNELRKKSKLVSENNPVPFDNTNIAFDPDEVRKLATNKPKNSVLVYDEGRAGLDSARAMENINKAMQDFFQECGQYGHVIIIVLPDFFKLNDTIAIPRSLFLINVYHDANYRRGYFSFFNEKKKELLYIFGKKKWGSDSKYMSVNDDFHGRFTPYFPINKEIYDEQKRTALKKKKKSQLEQRWHKERDASFYLLKKINKFSNSEIAKEVSRLTDIPIGERAVDQAITNIRKRIDALFSSEEHEDVA
jgi:hypothetical protein